MPRFTSFRPVPPPAARRGLRPVVVGCVVLAGLVTGCDRGAGTATPSATGTPTLHAPSVSAPASDPRVAAQQQALAAYRGMWKAYEAAVAVPDPNSPELARFSTGTALSTLVTGLKSVKAQGLKGTGVLTLSPQVTELSPADMPTSVSIQDCFDDSATRLVRVSGPPYSDTPGGRRLCLATVQRAADGSWRVTSYGLRGVGTC